MSRLKDDPHFEPAICECCHQPIFEYFERLGFRAFRQPFVIYWRDKEVHGLTPIMKRILFVMIEFGRVSFSTIDEILFEPGRKAAHVHVSRIRTTLRREGIDVRVTSIDGWGYILEHASENVTHRSLRSRVMGHDARRVAEWLEAQNEQKTTGGPDKG